MWRRRAVGVASAAAVTVGVLAGPAGASGATVVTAPAGARAATGFAGADRVLAVPLTPGLDRRGESLLALLPGPGSGFRTATYGAQSPYYGSLTLRGYTAAGVPNTAFHRGLPLVMRKVTYSYGADGEPDHSVLDGVSSDAEGRTYILVTDHPFPGSYVESHAKVTRLSTAGMTDEQYQPVVPRVQPDAVPAPGGDETNQSDLTLTSFLVLPDGRLRVCLEKWADPNVEWRYLVGFAADGAVEAGFGTGQAPGWAVLPKQAACGPMAVDSSGRLLLGNGTRLWRLTAAGAADTAYGTGGAATVPNAGAGIGAVAVTADGAALVGGVSGGDAPQAAPWVARVRADGSLDPGFGTAGVRVLRLAGRALTGLSVVGAKAYVSVSVPQTQVTASRANAVLRLDAATGAIDPSWGTNGSLALPPHFGNSGPGPLAVVPAGTAGVWAPYTARRTGTANAGYVRAVPTG